MIYLICLIYDLDHDLSDLSELSDLDRDLTSLHDLDHDLSDLSDISDLDHDLICLIYLILIMIYLI